MVLLQSLGGSLRSTGLGLQQPETTLEWLTVDLWPDYDRTSVLVLLTGSIAADVALPAEVTVPLPQDADLNAVARISDENQMIDDIVFERGDGTLALTTPDRRFRVEYYAPYQPQGLQRTFAYSWTGGPRVEQVFVSVQQPQAATTLTVEPEPETIDAGDDGLRYHSLPVSQVEAGGRFSVEVNYTMSSEQLTAPGGAPAAAPQGAGAGSGSVGDTTNGAGFLETLNWPVVLAVAGGALLLAAIGWQVFGARIATRRSPRKPRPLRAVRGQEANFCHRCGTQAQAGDRFCRECGTELKRS